MKSTAMKLACAVILLVLIEVVELQDSNLNKCEVQMKYVDENFEMQFVWARRMKDAWGRFPSGVYSGNLVDFGSFDQCIDFKHESATVGEIKGQYCLLFFLYELRTSDVRGRFAPQPFRYELHK
jgi:hypothetical protein